MSRPPRPRIRRAPPFPPEGALRLPHERDESPQPERGVSGPRDRIRQAARDVADGLVDTEARGTPSNVPQGKARRAKR